MAEKSTYMRFRQKIYCKFLFSADLARNLLYIWSRNKLARIDYTRQSKVDKRGLTGGDYHDKQF